MRERAWQLHNANAPKSLSGGGLRLLNSLPRNAIAAGYFPIRDELDPLPLLHAFYDKSVRIALPKTLPGPALVFREWVPGTPLTAGKFGLYEPDGSHNEVVPDLVLVPLLAFDRKGNRLGYGAGYYDAGLRSLRRAARTLAVGVAFDEQEFPAVPREPQDELLDRVLTPSRLIVCGD